VEALYGYLLGKINARNVDLWTPRVDIDVAAEPQIDELRYMAVNAILSQPFSLSYELSPNKLYACRPRSQSDIPGYSRAARVDAQRLNSNTPTRQPNILPQSARKAAKRATRILNPAAHVNSGGTSPIASTRAINQSWAGASDLTDSQADANGNSVATKAGNGPAADANFVAVTSDPENPSSSDDCNMGSLPGTWMYKHWRKSSTMISPLQNCCASACLAVMQTTGVSPTMLLMKTCCKACNKYSCDPEAATAISAFQVMTIVDVPSPGTGYATTVSIDL
jgi:hypothetical protein